jgi:hypothetical protein
MNEALTDNYNPIYDTIIKIKSNTRNLTHSIIKYPPVQDITSNP